jgi:hypothetical protein
MHWLHGFPYRQAIHLRSGRNGVVFDQHLTAICDLLDVGRDMQAIVAKLVQLHAVLVVHHADRLAWNESQASNMGGAPKAWSRSSPTAFARRRLTCAR